ncbi:uncharacterized protein LOC136764438 [Amia ocellicauda]|uniref:uncharacterized protein LOC136764438 n=1 Tax=Amia ocellicauda TaxID=2972642 RepID=UPI0034643A1C
MAGMAGSGSALVGYGISSESESDEDGVETAESETMNEQKGGGGETKMKSEGAKYTAREGARETDGGTVERETHGRRDEAERVGWSEREGEKKTVRGSLRKREIKHEGESTAEKEREGEKHRESEGEGEGNGRNFLLASEDDEDSSELDSEAEPGPSTSINPQLAPNTGTLPPNSSSATPLRLLPAPVLAPLSLGEASVFSNPFRENDRRRLSLLEHHVPLSLSRTPPVSGPGVPRVCVGFAKTGRCRFGQRCKFLHAEDNLGGTGGQSDSGHSQGQSGQGHSGQSQSHNGQSHSGHRQSGHTPSPSLNSSLGPEGGAQRRRKGAGLTDSLTPPKRALKAYSMQREREGHWD